MLDHLTRLRELSRPRTAGGIAASITIHLLLLALLVYGTSSVRENVRAGREGGGGEGGAAGAFTLPGQLPSDPPPNGSATGDSADLAIPDMILSPEVLAAMGVDPVLPRLPDTLELGRGETIRLALAPTPIPADSTVQLPEGEGNGVNRVALSAARLAGVYGENLVVEPRSPPLQLTSTERRTEWHWTITPTQPGPQSVYLQLDAPAEINGKDGVVTVQRMRMDVFVEVSPLQRISRFFAQYWTVLVLATTIATVGWVRAIRLRAPAV